MYDADFIAGCAELAMLLEVSATPKPGNVDRTHNFEDVTYEHFLASAVGVYPIFKKAASARHPIGAMVLDAVQASTTWQKAGNCHFGAILLLIPLCVAARESGTTSTLKANLVSVTSCTSIEDAVKFYEAFRHMHVRVEERHDLDVNDPSSLQKIRQRKLTLQDIMKLSSSSDTIAKEWVEGFPRTFHGAELISQYTESGFTIKESISRAFVQLLSEFPDTLIAKKFGSEIANEVSKKAAAVMRHGDIYTLDEELVARHLNPGATADLIAASLFIVLLGGFRY
ncbi:MAG TPA: triphosphoribosyl-dephospho-CoA synthase [Candidatus Bathyarchaeia archaeon]|nr:triphosphoribosyl-dephospho-CoA synthase [Candidatus Bathyarchaeia archaeon]